ncbi:MAG: redoxin domain-containing protein [Flavobacteriaceae bacterium]|nr:redoxin domain-containing protein [Flavobacteriaceae bacterium]
MQLFKKNNWVVLAIIALPSLFYFGLKTGNHQYKRLPIYGEHQQIIRVKKSTKAFYTLHNFSFINQHNEIFSSDDLKDKITIIGFFNKNDATFTPEILTNIKYLQQKFEGDKNVQFLAVSTTEIDANQLKEMAQKVTKNTENFYFVSANQLETDNFINKKLFIDSIDNENIPTDLVLIDFRGRIRSYFDGTVHKTVKQNLIDAIDILLKELYVPLKEDRKPLITTKKS